MRGKIAITHQFGDADLEVDGAAQILVAAPFGEAGIVWRSGGERDDAGIGQLVCEAVKALPPCAAQMVRLVEYEGVRPPLFERGDQPVEVFAAPEAVERLVG